MKRKQFNKYVEIIMRHFDISRELLFTNTKERDVADARHNLYWACYAHGNFRSATIIRMMKVNGYNIGHSTIKYGIDKIIRTEEKSNLKLQKKLCSV